MSCQIEERPLDKKVYRDDGLAVVEVQHDNFQHYNNVKKGVHKAVKDETLTVVIEDAKRGIDFLDVTLSVVTKVYTPYAKPGDKLTYVDN